MIRYRTGIDAMTGRAMVGIVHLQQSIVKIISTQLGERIMLGEFGLDRVRHIGRNLSAEVILQLYSEVIVAIHRWEPEFRVNQVQVVTMERTGSLGLGFSGTYYPEGRLNNYQISEAVSLNIPLLTSEIAA